MAQKLNTMVDRTNSKNLKYHRQFFYKWECGMSERLEKIENQLEKLADKLELLYFYHGICPNCYNKLERGVTKGGLVYWRCDNCKHEHARNPLFYPMFKVECPRIEECQKLVDEEHYKKYCKGNYLECPTFLSFQKTTRTPKEWKEAEEKIKC